MASLPPLKLLIAAPRGFCAGVSRAVEIVERVLEIYGRPVYVKHEIIHNHQVVADLRHPRRAEDRAEPLGEERQRKLGLRAVVADRDVEVEAQCEGREVPQGDERQVQRKHHRTAKPHEKVGKHLQA